MRLVDSPPCRSLLVIGFDDISTAADHTPTLLELSPLGLEGIDRRLIDDSAQEGAQPRTPLEMLPSGDGFLFHGARRSRRRTRPTPARAGSRTLLRTMPGRARRGALRHAAREQAMMWQVRESGLGATARVPGTGDTWPGWEDSAVPPERFGDYLRELRELLDRYDYEGDFYGHFGQGCLHTRITFDLETAQGIDDYHRVRRGGGRPVRRPRRLALRRARRWPVPRRAAAAHVRRRAGAGVSRAQGDLRSRRADEPGQGLRPVPDRRQPAPRRELPPWEPETVLRLPRRRPPPSRATLRCVGVGKCRREEGGTMCPSYMVTGEEKDSTRGRAHALHEMLVGDVVAGELGERAGQGGARPLPRLQGVQGGLPGQRRHGDVQGGVPLPLLPAHHRRPVTAYSMGLIHWWARLAGARTAAGQYPDAAAGASATLLKRFAGIAPERRLPRFADGDLPRALRPARRAAAAAAGGGAAR